MPQSERKPNPKLLLDICEREEVSPEDACYVGDSLTRDISMAKSAGVTAEDVAREAELKRHVAGVKPDHTIDAFREIKPIVLS